MKNFCLMLVVCFIFGCAGSIPSPANREDSTSVNLNRGNYKVLKQAAQGVDTGVNLFGFIPIVPVTYGNAMASLYRGVSTEGKSAALINVNKDYGSTYYFLFSIPSITITADVVEFTEDKK